MNGKFSQDNTNDEFKTGVYIIDYQHQLVFELFDKLENPIKDRNQLYELLIDISNYLHTHFQTEEEFMQYIKYPNFDEHKKCHDKFLSAYKEIVSKSLTNIDFEGLNEGLKGFLANWIEKHYKSDDENAEHDKKLIDYCVKNKKNKFE